MNIYGNQVIQKGWDMTTANDAEWKKLNNDALNYASNMDWGFYRNTRFLMAEILRKEKNFKAALPFYLEICYLDINGSRNVGSIKNDKKMLKEFPPFDLSLSLLAPGIIDRIEKIIKKTDLPIEKVEEIFIEMANHYQKIVPVSPKDAWEKMIVKLNE
jgi:hypothetical protein